jgi:hypothetical protein
MPNQQRRLVQHPRHDAQCRLNRRGETFRCLPLEALADVNEDLPPPRWIQRLVQIRRDGKQTDERNYALVDGG